MALISVVMSFYKEPIHYLEKAIDSILNQSFRDFECIVICDYPQNIEGIALVNEKMQNDDRVKLFINEKNLGLTASLNKGIQLSQGTYIARMDADDISVLQRLENQLQYLQIHQLDLIGGFTQVIDEDGNTLYDVANMPIKHDAIVKVEKYTQCIAHPTWLGKRDMFVKLEGYRPIPLTEDTDFVQRAIIAGYRVGNIPEMVLRYRMTSNSISRSNMYEQFLYLTFLTNCYKKKEIANIEDAHAYVNTRKNESKSKKFSLANTRFQKMLNVLGEKKYGSFIIQGVKVVFTSFAFDKKILRFVLAALYGKG